MDCLVTATVRRAKDGSVVGYQGIIRDITERKRAEEEIRRRSDELATLNAIAMTVASTLDLQEVLQAIQERLMESLGEIYPLLFFLFNEEDQTFKATPTHMQEQGLKRVEKLMGVNFEEVSLPLPALRPALREALLAGKPYLTDDLSDLCELEISRELKDAQRELEIKSIVALPLWVKGKLAGIMLLVSPKEKMPEEEIVLLSAIANQAAIAIENARLYEDAKNRIDHLSSLLMSHELRGPLTNIKAAVQTWNSLVSDGDGLQRELVSIVQQESDRLVWFLDRIFKIAALEAGMAAPEWREVSLRSLVAKGADPSWLPKHSHRLEVLVDGELKVRTDEGCTVMAIRNLLENAIKHCPPRSQIEVRGSRMDENWAKVTVLDNGPGIAPRDVGQIFRKFYRGQDAVDQGISGQGLGLYLVRLLVEAQGGTVWVDSEERNGASFSFSLPLAH